MKVEATSLKDCFIIHDTVFEDSRGYFFESFNRKFFYDLTGIDANFDSNSILRMNSLIYRDAWSVNYQHDEIRNKLDLSYNFSDSNYSRSNYGHSLNIGLETNKNTLIQNNSLLSPYQSGSILYTGNNNLAQLPWNYQVGNKSGNKNLGKVSWHYRSENLLNDGRSLVDAEIGYGIGTAGQGVLASLSTVIVPGVELAFNYQDISVVSNDRLFFLRVNLNARVQPNPSLSNRAYTVVELRGEGGLFIQPFLDKNDNGKFDEDDSIYTENATRLLQLDGLPVSVYNTEVGVQGLYIRQQAGKYRLIRLVIRWRANPAKKAMWLTSLRGLIRQCPFHFQSLTP